MTKIKNIIFDLGGVILNLDYSKTVIEFQKLGLLNFEKLYSQKKQSSVFDDFEKGRINANDFISSINKFYGLNINKTAFTMAWNAMLLDIPKERVNYIRELKKDFKIFLLSNTNEIHIKKFESDLRKSNNLKDFQNCFDKIYYSSNMGMRKPDMECFKKVINEHGLKPDETLFIDDSIQHVNGAKRVGIKAMLLKKKVSILDLVPDTIPPKLH